MSGAGRRQLPSWMLKASSAEEASISEVKEENKENAANTLDTKVSEPRKKVQRKKLDSAVPVLDKKSHLLKKCASRTRQGKLSIKDEDQSDNIQHGNGQHILKQCKTSRSKRKTIKAAEEQGDDWLKSDMETNNDGSVRKRFRRDAPGENKKAKRLVVDSYDGIVASDDELTVDDLISIAEEYMNAGMEKELQKSQNLGFESETKSPVEGISKIGSRKDLTAAKEDLKPLTDEPLSLNSSSNDPLPSKQKLTYPGFTSDPALDMLNLFLGPLLKKSKEVERKNDHMLEKRMLDHELSKRNQHELAEVERKNDLMNEKRMLEHELSKRSQHETAEVERKNDLMNEKRVLDHELNKRSQHETAAEVVPVMPKKASLKDRVAMLLG